ncbi:PREDICTED: GATA zinc finger domain-containing protein 14-like [Polistes dominula]|uniref:GATA zinc finger domain-containing protein 14-like n=1 Tax=Polistes dominula TaxID=743375 RepID=A0ABM1HT64_POLDO|nr:PREDICTED: GATA zinc finger domain-containing protein 14-like [Polistes dominula]
MSTKKQNVKICCFCGLAEDNEFEFGKFYEYRGIVTHYYCLLLSSNMEQKGRDNEGILGFLLGDIQKELRRGKRLVCFYCKKSGATLGCCNTKCKRIFHFPCGLKAGTLHQFFGEFRSYCINHRPKQKFSVYTKELIKEKIDVICYICYDKVNIKNLIDVLWTPCCKKDAWFHKKCVQQLASNAGYFFKCPLCNNKKEFQKAMLEQGIFIPSQDASWELEPNAFHELLYRHNRCDAVTCLCPKGRNHTSINAKWELALCRTCGSQGIHMACGQLKWAKPIWNCDECISILDKVNHSSNKVSETVNITYHGTDTDASDSEISVCESQNKDDFSIVSYSPSSATSQTFEQNPTNISTKNISENNCSSSNQNMFTISSVNSPEKSSNITLNRSENKNISLIDQNKTIIQTNQEKGQTDLKETINRLLTDEKRSILNKSQDKNLQSEEESISRDKKVDLIMIDSDEDDIEIISNLKKSDIKGQTLMNMDLPNCDINTKNKNPDQLINISCSSSYIPETYNNQMKTNRKTSDNLNKRKDCEIVTVNNVKDNMFSENENHEDVDNSPVMNIKITNVTSLSPEVFASVPSLERLDNHKVLQLNTKPSMSLNNFENLQTEDRRLSFSKYQSNETKTSSKRKHETNICVIGTHTNGVQSVTITNITPKKVRTSYLEENMEASCSSTTYNEVKQQIANQNNIKPSQKYVNDRNYQSDLDIFNLNNYRKNKISCPSSTTEVFTPTLELSNHNIAESQVKSAPSWASDASTTINKDVIITRIRNNSTHQSSNTKQNFTKRKTTSSKNSDSSEINNEIQSTLKQFDGDAGTSFTNESTDDCIQRNDDRINPKRASINKRSLLQCIDSRENGCKKHLNFNSFSEIASNPNACDKPRLIPESVQLQDLKFKVKDSNSVQMILYDTFSVNIHMNTAMKNHVRNSAASVGVSNMRRSLLELNDESNIDNCSSTETLYNSHLISDKDMCTSDTIVSRNVFKQRDDVKENYYPTTQTSLVTMY